MRIAVYVLTAMLAGCTTMGSEEFGCTGLPNSVNCMTPKMAYELSEDPRAMETYLSELEKVHEDYADGKIDKDEYTKRRSQLARDALEKKQAVSKQNSGLPDALINPIQQPMPVLMQAKVLRGWYGPLLDSNGDLHMPGLVYTEVTPRRWNLGEEVVRQSSIIGALGVRVDAESAKPTADTKDGKPTQKRGEKKK